MIIFSKKNIHRWKYWRSKSKFTFCLISGAFYTLLISAGHVLIKFLLGNTEELLASLLGIALGTFVSASFLSIALWYENERRYKLWSENSPIKKNKDHEKSH